MKNDISHHVILLSLIFAQFCRIFPGKTGFRIRKTGYPIQKFICVKTYLGQGEYYMRISAKLVKKHPKIRVFPDFYKIRIPNWELFCLKSFRDQDGANKKKFSRIGPKVPEEIGNIQASKQTSCCFSIEIFIFCQNRYTYF